MFRYSFDQHCELSQDILDLLEQVDEFPFSQLSYSLGASPYQSFGYLHNTLENVFVKSNAGTRTHTVRMTIQKVRELFEEWTREVERMRAQNIPDLYWPRPWILRRTLEEHANEPENTVVDIETTHDLGGYYSRNTNQPVQGYVVLRFDTRKYPLVCTYIHEMMHAFYDADLRNPMNDAEYAEEPLAEYGMLHFVESFVRSHPEHLSMLTYAKDSVSAKQFDLGIAHYGFGAYLYEQFQHIEWERLMRAAHSKIINTTTPYTDLEAALQGAYPTDAQLPHVAQLLYDVLNVNNKTKVNIAPAIPIQSHSHNTVFTQPEVYFSKEEIVENMLNMLPSVLFTSPDTVFLDPYLDDQIVRGIIHRLYEGLRTIIPDNHERFVHICTHQILFIDHIPEYCFIKESKADIIHKYLHSTPRIDVVIGLPPFQQDTDSSIRATIIYPDYVQRAMDIAQYTVMTIPFRWTTGIDSMNSAFRQMLCNTQHLSSLLIYHNLIYHNSKKVPKGLCSICVNTQYVGDTDVFVYDDKLVSCGTYNIGSEISIFGTLIVDNLSRNILLHFESCPHLINSPVSVVGSAVFGRLRDFYSVTSTPTSIVVVLSRQDRVQYVDLSLIKRNTHLIAQYKVYLSMMGLKPILVLPNQIGTDNMLMVGCFATQIEAVNCVKYFSTKIVRFLIATFQDAIFTLKSHLRFVPEIDYTTSSDINWSASIDDIDLQLCQKYGLSHDEWAYIDGKI